MPPIYGVEIDKGRRPGVRKLNKQAVDFGYVVLVKLNSGVQIQSH